MQSGLEKNRERQGVLTELAGDRVALAPAIERLEKVLGIHHEFPAAFNLVRELKSLLAQISDKSVEVKECLEAIEAVEAAGESRIDDARWVEVPSSGRAGNPLGERFKKYPLPSFLLQEPFHSIRAQGEHLKALFLTALLKNSEKPGIAGMADLFRKVMAHPDQEVIFVLDSFLQPTGLNSAHQLSENVDRAPPDYKSKRAGDLHRALKQLTAIARSKGGAEIVPLPPVHPRQSIRCVKVFNTSCRLRSMSAAMAIMSP